MAAPTKVISNDKELADFLTEHILDEELDPTQIAILLSSAKNEIERNERPTILVDEDATKTRSSGDTYLTTKALSDDFRLMLELYVGSILYTPVDFRKRRTYKDSPRAYYIDYKNSVLAICGVGGASEAITQVYLVDTNDFTAASVVDTGSATLTWPKDFWELCAWKVAEIISTGTDVGADDLSFRMSQGQTARYQALLHAFRNWDQDIKLHAQNNRAGYDESVIDQDLEEDILPYMT